MSPARAAAPPGRPLAGRTHRGLDAGLGPVRVGHERAPGAYGRVLFSMHMVQHMTIATTVPRPAGARRPGHLGATGPASPLRTAPWDRESGSRDRALSAVRRFLSHPLVAAGIFIVSLVVFYYSHLFPLALESHTGHVLMTAHFLCPGYLFAGCLVGIDPGLRQPAYPLRVLLVMVTFGFHALLLGSAHGQLHGSSREDWFTSCSAAHGRHRSDDQYLGASLGWALGDYPLALLAGLLVFSWVRADRRERDRFDRQEDRDGDSRLTAYNSYLSGLAPGSRGANGPSADDSRDEKAHDS